MFNPADSTTVMAVMFCLFTIFMVGRSMIKGRRRGLSTLRLAMMAGLGVLFIGFVCYTWIF